MKKNVTLECSENGVAYIFKMITTYSDGVVTTSLYTDFQKAYNAVIDRLDFHHCDFTVSEIIPSEYVVIHVKNCDEINYITIERIVLYGCYV